MSARLNDDPIQAGMASWTDAHQLLDRAARERGALWDLIGLEAVAQFEQAAAIDQASAYALAVSSGTAALQTALLAADVGLGDEVILSPYGWGQTVAAVLSTGATPVFADVLAETGHLDPASVAERISPATKVILPTHLFGWPAPMQAINTLAHDQGLLVIADAAQAWGASLDGRPIGADGDLTCFSLGAGKAVSAGEGGLITTQDADLYERMVLVSQHPLRASREVESAHLRAAISQFGLSYRLASVQAAVALADFKGLQTRLVQRRQQVKAVQACFAAQPLIFPMEPADVRSSWYQLVAQFVGSSAERDLWIKIMQRQGVSVEAGPVRIPLNARPPFNAQLPTWMPKALRPQVSWHPTWDPASCPVTLERCAREVLFENLDQLNIAPL